MSTLSILCLELRSSSRGDLPVRREIFLQQKLATPLGRKTQIETSCFDLSSLTLYYPLDCFRPGSILFWLVSWADWILTLSHSAYLSSLNPNFWIFLTFLGLLDPGAPILVLTECQHSWRLYTECYNSPCPWQQSASLFLAKKPSRTAFFRVCLCVSSAEWSSESIFLPFQPRRLSFFKE